MAKAKSIQKKAGRPRKYEDAAARVRAFRAKAAYPGHRYDVYLSKDAHVIIRVLMKRHGLSATGVVDAVLCGKLSCR